MNTLYFTSYALEDMAQIKVFMSDRMSNVISVFPIFCKSERDNW